MGIHELIKYYFLKSVSTFKRQKESKAFFDPGIVEIGGRRYRKIKIKLIAPQEVDCIEDNKMLLFEFSTLKQTVLNYIEKIEQLTNLNVNLKFECALEKKKRMSGKRPFNPANIPHWKG